MSLVQVSRELQREVRAALSSPFRFERHERFAMLQLMQSGQIGDLADTVYVDAARNALHRHGARFAPAGYTAARLAARHQT